MISFLDGLSDESLKKEAATDTRSETFSSIMKVRWMDGWMDGWMVRWTDGWMDG